jgi:hypothetical protein
MNERLQAVIVSAAYKINEGKPEQQIIAEMLVLGATQEEAAEAYRLAQGIVNEAYRQGGWFDFVIGGALLFGAWIAVILYDKSQAAWLYGAATIGFFWGCYRICTGLWKSAKARFSR